VMFRISASALLLLLQQTAAELEKCSTIILYRTRESALNAQLV